MASDLQSKKDKLNKLYEELDRFQNQLENLSRGIAGRLDKIEELEWELGVNAMGEEYKTKDPRAYDSIIAAVTMTLDQVQTLWDYDEFKESFSKWTSKSYNRTETNNRYFNLAFTGRSETEIDREVYSLAIKRLVDVAILMDDHYVAKVMLKRIEEREQDPKEQRRRKELFNEN